MPDYREDLRRLVELQKPALDPNGDDGDQRAYADALLDLDVASLLQRLEFAERMLDGLSVRCIACGCSCNGASQFCDSAHRENWPHEWVTFQQAQIDGLRDECNRLRSERDGEVWLWQGDGEDHPESLACPVVMRPDQVRSLLKRLEELEAENERLRAELSAGEQAACKANGCTPDELTVCHACDGTGFTGR